MIHVVAGAVTDAAGRILIAQRPPGKHLAGGWEFPGGKLEPGETRAAGLGRELREELGISIGAPRPLLRLHHSYPFGEVLIDMWVVTRYMGEPRGLDGQALQWVTLDELATVELLPADAPIVRALRLPERLTQGDTAHYGVLDYHRERYAPDGADRLRGIGCSCIADARSAAREAAPDFLVMRSAVAADELRDFCAAVEMPVFVRDLELESAWALGASGINSLAE